jgi:hypothetical protein
LLSIFDDLLPVMPIKINSVIKRTVIIGMIGLMGMLTINKVVFMHTHKIADHTYISHSHPYNKSDDTNPYKSHHHTEEEFLFFQNIEILFPFFVLTIILISFSTKSRSGFEYKQEYIFEFIRTNRGRAPPVS